MSLNETAPDYRDIVVTLSPTARIINCKDNIQWIIQVRSGSIWRSARSAAFWRWRGPLIAHLDCEAAYQGNAAYALTYDTRKTLEALPERHP